MYHASLTQHTKKHVCDNFQSGQIRCISATIAFGMGMDISDVELVIVNGVPSSMLQFYQLCGRAGRNGCQSRAHLIYSGKQKKFDDEKLHTYCTSYETVYVPQF